MMIKKQIFPKQVFFSTLLVLFCLSFSLSSLKVLALEPANPNASSQTRQILNWINELPQRSENRVISAQHVSHGTWNFNNDYQAYVVALANQTGKWPAMIGVDYGVVSTPAQIKNANSYIIDHWNKGGLVTIEDLAYNPWTGGDPWDRSYRNLAELINPNSSVYSVWRKDLDKIADGLMELQNAGITVIFRPYPEMNYRESFWWDMGAVLDDHPEQGEAVWIAMWRDLFNYFTYEKGLNNLIWMFAAANVDYNGWCAAERVYPGNNYVDMVGLDIYSDWPVPTEDTYETFTSFGKPFAYAEVGPGATMDGSFDNLQIIRGIKEHPLTTYFQTWHSWEAHNTAMVNNRNAYALLTDPWVITRDEVDWSGQAIPTTSPNPTASPNPTSSPSPTTAPTSAPTIAPQPSPTPTPTGIPGDLNNDGYVNVLDLMIVSNCFNQKAEKSCARADANGRDAFINVFDLVFVSTHYTD